MTLRAADNPAGGRNPASPVLPQAPDDKRLVLVDGSSFLYRAFHGLPPLSTSTGEPTGAILGVANMLRKLLGEYPDAHIGVIFDAPGKSFRNDLYEHYKAHRPPMPEDLRAQTEPLLELIRAMGMPVIRESGVEADDVIGTLTAAAVAQGYRVVISTGDKDMAQLVNASVLLENTMTDTRMDAAGVQEKFGVPPERIVDYLALVGDSSDNIPGVPKCGPKTAVKWLNEFGSLEELMLRADEVGGKIGENLRGSLAAIPLSRLLATIKCDVELPLQPDDLRLREPDNTRLRALLERFEFRAWLKQFDAKAATSAPAPETAEQAHYQCILTREAFEGWLQRLTDAPLFAFDTETTSLDYTQARIVGVSFAVEPGEAAYVPLAHDYPDAPAQLHREEVLARLKPLLEDPRHCKLGQNLKYDAHVLANHNIVLRGGAHDTMLESYVLNSTATRHDMDSLASYYLKYTTLHYEDVAGKGAKQVAFSQVDIEQATRYAAEDADVTLKLHETLWPRLQSFPAMQTLYQEIEIPLIAVLGRMEAAGVLVDTAMLAAQGGDLALRMAEIEQQAYREAGETFNLGSPKQIQSLLFEKHKLPVIKKTPTGQPSTDESVLQELAEIYPLPRLILDYRAMSKLKSTYADRLPEQVNPLSGRVHTSYHQAVAATGRLSSSDPNLQNIPARTEEGRKIRQAFIAPPGRKIVAADYSQIELRIMAHLSGDESLLAAFAAGADIHRATAAEVFATAQHAVSAEQRRAAKAINFGLIYGMSAFGLARQLGISREKSQLYIDLYFQRYPGVKRYMDVTRERARESGYVETLFGRRLYLPDINAKNGQRRQYAERTAINAPMQGSAADIIKRAMLAVDRWIIDSGAPVCMIMQVHDELVFEIDENALASAMPEVNRLMTGAAELRVPLLVGMGAGNNWDEAH